MIIELRIVYLYNSSCIFQAIREFRTAGIKCDINNVNVSNQYYKKYWHEGENIASFDDVLTAEKHPKKHGIEKQPSDESSPRNGFKAYPQYKRQENVCDADKVNQAKFGDVHIPIHLFNDSYSIRNEVVFDGVGRKLLNPPVSKTIV